MGDFPREWILVRDLEEGGQGYTYVVKRSDRDDPAEYVLKRLKNPKREDYFDREILACQKLDHPNVLKVLEHGKTPKGKPFLITEYCSGGSLAGRPPVDSPSSGLRLFEQIVAGVAHAHSQEPPIYHLDIKPENILLKKSGTPVVGDWGICFIEDGAVTMTKEGPRGSIYYCAPELRGPKINAAPLLAVADVYSLGKVLYFLFSGDVFDGHEDEYSNDASKSLGHLYPSNPQMVLVDEIINLTVRRIPSERVSTAKGLLDRVRRTAERIDAGGRVLDLQRPQRCLYCAEGHYKPAHTMVNSSGYSAQHQRFPPIEERNKPDNLSSAPNSRYAYMRDVAAFLLGSPPQQGIPLMLICDHCGNVQYFRLEYSPKGYGENWKP